MNTGIKDPSTVMLNIDRKFEKMTAFTSDGNKLGFFVHHAEKKAKEGAGANG